MKRLTGWAVCTGLMLAAAAANAQMAVPYGAGSASVTAVSDFDGPYTAVPPGVPGPGYGPMLLPSTEVYTVLREGGFSPLGIPRLRGNVYSISAIDRHGDDGKLVIDARTGRIIRFVPAYRDDFDDELNMSWRPRGLLPPTYIRGVPRPPMPVPHVASRSVPVPKPHPLQARPAAAPAPAQQVAAAPPKVSEAPQPAPPAPAPTVGAAKPAAPSILPTQDMPQAQGLE